MVAVAEPQSQVVKDAIIASMEGVADNAPVNHNNMNNNQEAEDEAPPAYIVI